MFNDHWLVHVEFWNFDFVHCTCLKKPTNIWHLSCPNLWNAGHWSKQKFDNFFLSHFKLHNLLDISIFDSNATETSQVLRNFFRLSGYNFFALASPKDDKLYYQVLYKGCVRDFVFPLHLLQKLSTNTRRFYYTYCCVFWWMVLFIFIAALLFLLYLLFEIRGSYC